MSPRHARIAATGRYVPDRVVANAELEELLGEPVDEWLVANVGIRERHVMAADQTTSDLAVAAARECLRRTGRSPAELDLVLVATDTPDYLSPATSSVVQAKLGARRAATFDVNCACAAWVTALDVAGEEELLAFLRTRLARYKLPRGVRFVPELPISPQGKVLKRLLRAT